MGWGWGWFSLIFPIIFILTNLDDESQEGITGEISASVH
jgi:hypothetical protein